MPLGGGGSDRHRDRGRDRHSCLFRSVFFAFHLDQCFPLFAPMGTHTRHSSHCNAECTLDIGY